jgi:hypothetical protein
MIFLFCEDIDFSFVLSLMRIYVQLPINNSKLVIIFRSLVGASSLAEIQGPHLVKRFLKEMYK